MFANNIGRPQVGWVDQDGTVRRGSTQWDDPVGDVAVDGTVTDSHGSTIALCTGDDVQACGAAFLLLLEAQPTSRPSLAATALDILNAFSAAPEHRGFSAAPEHRGPNSPQTPQREELMPPREAPQPAADADACQGAPARATHREDGHPGDPYPPQLTLAGPGRRGSGDRSQLASPSVTR